MDADGLLLGELLIISDGADDGLENNAILGLSLVLGCSDG